MVRNQNGLNYKVMTLRISDNSLKSAASSFLNTNYDTTILVIILSIIVLVIVISSILIFVLFRKSKRRKKMANSKLDGNHLNNEFTRKRSQQNDYFNHPNRNKQFNEQSMKNSSFLINNLVQTGRTSNLLNAHNYPSQYLNKHNRSKFSSISNSIHRLNNTPILDDTLSQNF